MSECNTTPTTMVANAYLSKDMCPAERSEELHDLGCEQVNSTVIYEDNQGCMAMAHNPISHKRMKHIDIRYHYLREVVQDGVIEIQYSDEILGTDSACETSVENGNCASLKML